MPLEPYCIGYISRRMQNRGMYLWKQCIRLSVCVEYVVRERPTRMNRRQGGWRLGQMPYLRITGESERLISERSQQGLLLHLAFGFQYLPSSTLLRTHYVRQTLGDSRCPSTVTAHCSQRPPDSRKRRRVAACQRLLRPSWSSH